MVDKLRTKLDIYFNSLNEMDPTAQEYFATLYALVYQNEELDTANIEYAFRNYVLIKGFLDVLKIEIPPEIDSELEKKLLNSSKT